MSSEACLLPLLNVTAGRFTSESLRLKTFCLTASMMTSVIYEGWNFNSGNYLFTTDTK